MKALIIVDVQNDFVEGGPMAVAGGKGIVPRINQLQPEYDLVVATKDWHPEDHGSFAENHEGRNPGEVVDLNGLDQILWPTHCIQESPGAEFVPGLNTEKLDKVIFKGTDAGIDSYSGFFDNGKRKATGLGDYLKEKGITEVHVLGLATDYCVKFTALDAVALGFKTALIADASRGVDLQPGDVDQAIEEMRNAGIEVFQTEDVVAGR